MPPKSKPSTFLRNCSIVIVGNLGKDVKNSDIEKWVVNNGGTYKKNIDNKTTHALCTLATYKENDFALAKEPRGNKKLVFVPWSWLEDSLQARKVKPFRNYVHSRHFDKKAHKKNVRRQALLTGSKSATSNKGKKVMKIGDPKELEAAEEDRIAIPEKSVKNQDVVESDADSKTTKSSTPFSTRSSSVEKSAMKWELYTDEAGVTWEVHLKGDDLTDNSENVEYTISVLSFYGETEFYKAQYTYYAANEEPITLSLWQGSSFQQTTSQFKGFYKNKAGRDWAEKYEELKADVGLDAMLVDDEVEDAGEKVEALVAAEKEEALDKINECMAGSPESSAAQASHSDEAETSTTDHEGNTLAEGTTETENDDDDICQREVESATDLPEDFILNNQVA